MSRRTVQNYLRTYRLKWGLSQGELGALLGLTRSGIGKIELGKRRPSVRLIISCKIIFGATPAQLFPVMYQRIEDALAMRALRFDERLRNRKDRKSRKKLKLLQAMTQRTEEDSVDV